MKRLQVFNTNPEYNSAKDIFKYPTVAHIKENLDTKFMNEEEYYSKQYLTFEALEDCVFTLTIDKDDYGGHLDIESISYSIDNGNTWITNIRNSSNSVTTITTPIIYKGEIILWKGIANVLYQKYGYGPGLGVRFLSSGKYKVFGNINSIHCGDNFIAYNNSYVFGKIFSNNTNLISAKNLILPAISLARYCYEEMFINCSSLLIGPNLPATILSPYCYERMFMNCTSLTSAPELRATSLVSSCYNQMFLGCTNLNYIMALFITNPNGDTSYTSEWVTGVAQNGTFVKSIIAHWEKTGSGGVPTNWNIEYIWPKNFNYFTTEAIDECEFSFKFGIGATTSNIEYIEYSIDGARTWIRTNNINNQEVTVTTPIIQSKHKVRWRGVGKSLTGSTYNCSQFSSTGRYNISGNIMSLISCYDNIPIKYTFTRLFQNSTNLINAKNLILPSTNLTEYCYANMFNGCTSIISGPNLPATALADNCYANMFANTNILPDCTNIDFLNQYVVSSKGLIKLFASTKITDDDLYRILPKNSSNKYYLPLCAPGCYYHMFEGCTLLKTAPELPSMTLYSDCYGGMFYGCTSLVNPPTLPATTLSTFCYRYMFINCTSLVKAPELLATTLVSRCYDSMFRGCSSLNYIKALFTTTPSSTYTDSWVKGVSSSGTFVKNVDATWTTIGDNGVPTNWVINNTLPYNYNYLQTKAIDNSSFTFTIHQNLSTQRLEYIEYSIDNGENWIKTNNVNNTQITITTPQISAGNTVKWRGMGIALGSMNFSQSEFYISSFSSTGRYEVSGKILSLTNGVNTISNTNCTFLGLFKDSINLINANTLILPNNTSQYCYKQLFNGCTSLVNSPNLYNIQISSGCYEGMFGRCTSITSAPLLPATTIAPRCYSEMFSGCTSLVTPPNLPATTLQMSCYYNMFNGCTSLRTAPVLPATTLVVGCYQYMFSGCSSLNHINAQFLTTPAYDYTKSWVYGVANSGTFIKNPDATWNVTGIHGIPTGWTIEFAVAMGIWVDDFPGLYEIEANINDEEAYNSNCYEYTGNTMTYNNQTCYIWEEYNGIWEYGASRYLLTSTIDITTLNNQALQERVSYTNRFYSLIAFLNSDMSVRYDSYSNKVNEIKLIRVEDNNSLLIWINNYEEIPSIEDINYPEERSMNYYRYAGNTMTYNNQICYIWEEYYGYGGPMYLLTSTDDYETLEDESLFGAGIVASFDSFVAALDEDSELLYDTSNDWGKGLRLIKIEENEPPIYMCWIDDYPDDGDGTLDGEPIEDVIDRAIANPATSGANKYGYYGDTIQYNGNTYYLWKAISYKLNLNDQWPWQGMDCILTTTDNYNTLRSQSITVSGYNAQFTALYAMMNEDQTNVYEGNDVADQQLIKIVRM